MLTVDYEDLGLEPGELILDMGAGAGRHAFESLRRGGRIIALDYSYDELKSVRDLFWAMGEAVPALRRGDVTVMRLPR